MVTLFGAATSLLVGLLSFWIEQTFGISIYSWMYWFVIPIGALLCGAAAASGYYGGAKFFNHKPNPVILLNMVAISLGTYFLIQYLDYYTMTLEGKRVSDMVSFGQYWQVITSHSAMQFRFRATKIGEAVELGRMGYVYALLQIGGFAFGGLCVYFHLSSQIYCDRCSLYFHPKEKSTCTTNDPELLKSFLSEMAPLTAEGRLTDLIQLRAGKEWAKELGDHFLMTEIVIQHCKKCAQHHFRFEVKKKMVKGKEVEWEVIRGFSYSAFTDTPLTLIQSASTKGDA